MVPLPPPESTSTSDDDDHVGDDDDYTATGGSLFIRDGISLSLFLPPVKRRDLSGHCQSNVI